MSNNQQYGGLEGPNSAFVKLISSDGYEFIIKHEHALLSRTLRGMLHYPTPLSETEINDVNLRIPSHILRKVCQYLGYKARYMNNNDELPTFPIEPNHALDLLMAANFLDL